MKAIIHVNIYDYHQYINDGFVIYDKTIFKVGSMKEFVDQGYEIIDAKGRLMLPNFVVGHTHIYSTFARGASIQMNPDSFKEILEQLWWKLDRNLTNEMNYYSAAISAIEYVKNGVSTLIDHHASGEIKGSLTAIKQGVDLVGLKGLYCFETSDRFDIDPCIDENIEFSSKTNKGLFGMHASMSLSDKTLRKISKVNIDLPIHVHVAESIEDEEDSMKLYDIPIIDRFNRFGLLRENSIIVHGIYLNDEELKIIKDHQCVIAVNVTSNMNNGVGLPDIKHMMSYDIPIIIGNDGINFNMATEINDLYYAMHHKYQSITHFGLDDVKKMIQDTYAYASKMLDTKLGQIKEGYCSDFMLVDYVAPAPIHENNVFGHLFFGLFHDFKPKDVFVDGRCLVKQYQLTMSVDDIYDQAKIQAQKLWDCIHKEEE